MDERTVFLEREILMKQGYAKHREKSPALLYAHVFDEILSGLSIVTDPDDLIAGRTKETVPTDEDESTMRQIAAYYQDVCPEAVRAPERGAEDWAFFGRPGVESANPPPNIMRPTWFSTVGHITVSWETLLAKGMTGIKETAMKTAVAIKDGTDTTDEAAGSNDAKNRKKLEFLQAVIICCDAVIKLAERYADEFAALVANEDDAERKAELQTLEAILRKVPANPASTFREALQAVWVLDLIMHKVCGSRDYTPGRMDQYLVDYYRNDIESGRLTREEAIELLQNFFIHTVEISGLSDHTHGSGAFNYTTTGPVKQSLSKDSVQYLVLAGQTPDGKDASNELSAVMLDAIDEIRTKSPAVIIRYHNAIDRNFWLQVCDMMARSFNNIGIYNDSSVIEGFVKGGVKPGDAIGYSHFGCCNPAIPGKDAQLREDQRNLAKILELTLNNGYDPVADFQRGPHTGTVDTFQSFDDLMKAFKVQMDEDIRRAVERQEAKYEAYFREKPFAFESCLLTGCVEDAMDCNDPDRNPQNGGTGYLHTNIHGGALATTADSLAAVKKLVFDDKELTLPELKKALDSNFEGNEMLRLKLANKCPKFGNDEDYVDSIAADIGEAFCSSVLYHGNSNSHYAGLCWPTLYTYHRYRSCGLETGATPDGRKAFEPVSENQSPANGCDTRGVSALINSLSKLKGAFSMSPGGGLTINLHPTAVMVDSGAEVIAHLYETYFDQGGQYVQMNVIDKETLLEAKKHPEKHRDLLVRVTGYSAYFVSLSPESQDNIIARYAHSA